MYKKNLLHISYARLKKKTIYKLIVDLLSLVYYSKTY